MKIIEPGHQDLTWPRQIRVKCCEALLEVEPDEIKTDRDYTGDLNGYYLDCPSCGQQPDIDSRIKSDAARWLRQQERLDRGERL